MDLGVLLCGMDHMDLMDDMDDMDKKSYLPSFPWLP